MTTARTPIDNMIQDPELSDMLVKHVDHIKEYHLRNADRDTNGQFCRVGNTYRVNKHTLPVKKILDAIEARFGNPSEKFPVGGIVSGEPTGILIPKANGVHPGGLEMEIKKDLFLHRNIGVLSIEDLRKKYLNPICDNNCDISVLHGSYSHCIKCGKIIQ